MVWILANIVAGTLAAAMAAALMPDGRAAGHLVGPGGTRQGAIDADL